jgi:hypothetical protein
MERRVSRCVGSTEWTWNEISVARQNGIGLQRTQHRLGRTNMGVKLAAIIGDGVTFNHVSGSAMLLGLFGEPGVATFSA